MASSLALLFFFICGFAAGGAAVWVTLRARLKGEADWADRFKALAADTLRANNQAFLDLAETRLKQSEQQAAATLDKKSTGFDEMVKPVRESLQKLDTQIQALEVKREGAYRELAEMVRLSNEAQQQLRGETSQLLQALRTPTTRGRWGEIQLRRILEMTGMSAHTRDFSLQQSIAANDGTLRPDAIVNLPGERCIVIDSKVPLADYLNATQATEDTARQTFLRQHARHVREHVKDLSSKAYWSQIEGTPEFVVLFLPGDHFLAAALDQDADLMDFSVTQKIILATPMTLVALLRTVAYGWRQEALRDNARRVGALGGELYAALVTLTDHIGGLGNKLGGALDSYNKLIGSYERNVLSKARKLKEFGAAKDGKELPNGLDVLDTQPRSLNIADIGGQDDAA
ncbi:MAG: DNA recombination protein RmuC [Alphaproteobacteria bacterium]|nr:DNA recombination protein RmuC [Alphaproteobacteria bacterium]MBV8548151.1 DNA recombination protein RmuC [Alphaproteobacteria bacterium]